MYSPVTDKGATPCLHDLAVSHRPRFFFPNAAMEKAGRLHSRARAACACGTQQEGLDMVEYETISGFFKRVNPEAFDLIEEPEIDLIPDEEWLENKCKELGYRPRSSVVDGVMVKLFPVDLLRERLG